MYALVHTYVHTYICAQVVKPSLEEIQTVVNDAVSEVTSIGRFISVWADYEPQGGEDFLFTPRSEGSSNVHYGVLQGGRVVHIVATALSIYNILQ